MLPFLAVLGVIGWPRSSKMRPIRRAAEAARLTLAPLRLAVSFSWTASNKSRVTIAACSAFQSGAGRVHSFDYDPNSVAATKSLWERAGSPANWVVERGDALDHSYVR